MCLVGFTSLQSFLLFSSVAANQLAASCLECPTGCSYAGSRQESETAELISEDEVKPKDMRLIES